jgi:plastocyanin
MLSPGIAAADEARAPHVATHTVVIENLQYSPAELHVQRGERIVWVNKDLFPHTVTAASHVFDSGSIAANSSWTYVASKAGEYAYGCTFHPTMKGILKVQ